MFIIGRDYTRNQIHAHLGGSKQSYLPTKNGEVVAACLTKELNPRAPQVVLCGLGERIAPAGEALAQQSVPIPVFIKRAPNRWEYQGMFRVKESFTGGQDFVQLVTGSGRAASDVSRAVVLESTGRA
jgi:hypothetical protein